MIYHHLIALGVACVRFDSGWRLPDESGNATSEAKDLVTASGLGGLHPNRGGARFIFGIKRTVL